MAMKVAIYNCAHNEELNNIQVAKVTEYVNSVPDWQIDLRQDVYSDIGYSKMQTEGRPALEELINKVGEDKYDLIVMESISSYSRNRNDMIKLLEEFLKKGVSIYCVNMARKLEEIDFLMLELLLHSEQLRTSERVLRGCKCLAKISKQYN